MEKNNIEQLRQEMRARSVATVVAIGTANPSNCINQSDYPDYYFRVTNCDHLTELKDKLPDYATVQKRYFHMSEKILEDNPSITTDVTASLDARQDILVEAVPKLGAEAAERAIEEWGQPKSKITHLIFCTISGVNMPSADLHVTKLLGLNPSVNRLCIYHQGCFTSATALRLAKDISESNRHARVLIICSEITLSSFRGPSDDNICTLMAQAVFGDGAAALIVAADPDSSTEHPLYEIISASQTTVPDSESVLYGRLSEPGLTFNSKKELTNLIGVATENCLNEAFAQMGISDWNSIFWVMHPGAPAFADHIEEKLGLEKGKMHAVRHVLREYGNMESPSVLFVLDQMRKYSAIEGKTTTGEGLEWGVLLGFGPGLTVETIVLRSLPYE